MSVINGTLIFEYTKTCKMQRSAKWSILTNYLKHFNLSTSFITKYVKWYS